MKTPLTEDHLVKYGFELDDCDEGVCYWGKDNIYLEAKDNDFYLHGLNIATVEDLIKIFSLNGVELKIEEDIRF